MSGRIIKILYGSNDWISRCRNLVVRKVMLMIMTLFLVSGRIKLCGSNDWFSCCKDMVWIFCGCFVSAGDTMFGMVMLQKDVEMMI